MNGCAALRASVFSTELTPACRTEARKEIPQPQSRGGGYPRFVLRPFQTTEGEPLWSALHSRLPAVGPLRRAYRAPGRWWDRWGLPRGKGPTGRLVGSPLLTG